MMKKILKENWIYLLIIIVITVILSLVMRSSLHDKIIVFDYKVINYIKGISNSNLTLFFHVLTYFGDIYIPLVILLIILLFVNNRCVIIFQSLGYLFAGIITYISKIIVARPRPLIALIEIPKSYSFPSGHTLTSLVFYILLMYLLSYKMDKKYKVFLMVLSSVFSLMIAFSRIYLRVHYFSDVIGGFLIGVPCLLMIINIISKNFDKEVRK